MAMLAQEHLNGALMAHKYFVMYINVLNVA